MGPMLAVFTERVGGDILDIAWSWSIFLTVTGIFYIITGTFLNNNPYKARVMLLSYALNVLFTFGYLFVSNPQELFIVRA